MVDGNSELVDMEEKDLFKYDRYGVGDVMMIPLITGENGNIVKPGVNKNKAEQPKW